jgi:hypothetical protein
MNTFKKIMTDTINLVLIISVICFLVMNGLPLAVNLLNQYLLGA